MKPEINPTTQTPEIISTHLAPENMAVNDLANNELAHQDLAERSEFTLPSVNTIAATEEQISYDGIVRTRRKSRATAVYMGLTLIGGMAGVAAASGSSEPRVTKVMHKGEIVEVKDKLPTNKFPVYNLSNRADRKKVNTRLRKLYRTCDTYLSVHPYSGKAARSARAKNGLRLTATQTSDERWKFNVTYPKNRKLKLRIANFKTVDNRSYFTAKPTVDGKRKDIFIDHNVSYGPFAVSSAGVCVDNVKK